MIQTQCPTPDSLRQWTSGEGDEATANELAEHLRDCTQCQEILAGLEDRNSDSLVQQLKAADPLLEFREELDCQQASILAMGAITGQAMEETHTAMPVFPKEMDDYRLLELIASGGMGKVYRAHHQRLGRDVAIKIISGRRLADANASLRFEQEIRALGRLSHPNIVAALDARQADGSPILIMEYVDGLDLSQIVKRLGALPAASVAAVGRAVAAAIAYASSNGLVHRDIKPSNIMLNGKGEVKVLDLGLARIQLDGHVAPEWTGTGLAVGTPDYMSPEQINDSQTLNSQSDLYSLGCTLYRLLTGQPPYSGSKYRSNFEKLAAHVSDDPIRIPNSKGQYPAELVSIIERLVSKSPEKRPESAQTVALELERLSEGADLPGLLAMARKLQSVDSTTPASGVQQPRVESSRGGNSRIGSILRWTAALGGIPIGILLGIWLTIKNPDGSENKVQLPGNATAIVDNKGNVQIDMAKQESALPAARAANSNALDIGSQNPLQNPTSQPDVSDQEISGLMTTNASNQPLYRGHTFDEWAAVLPSERSIEMQKVIVDGIIGLAESQEQKRRATKLILEKCRTLGGFSIGGDGDSGAWMQLINKKMEDQRLYQLFPHPFVEEATAELAHANERSLLAILFICQGTPYEKLIDESDKGNKEPSPKWHELVSALHKAYERLKPENSFPKGYSVDITNYILAIASQLDVPYAKLDPILQVASRDAWEKFAKTKLEPIATGNTYVHGCSWLPYWKTLSQQDNRKAFVLQWFATHSVHPARLLRSLLENFGPFKSEEQTDICGVLARRYQTYFYAYDPFDWTEVVKCLKRSSSLASANMDELQEIVQARRVNGGMGASVRTSIDVSPERFAELLGVPLPPSDSNAPKRIVPPKGSNSVRQVPHNEASETEAGVKDDQEIDGLITAIASSNQPLYRGHSFDEWVGALKSERSIEMQKVSVDALIALAESPEQKSQAMKLILEKCRTLGGEAVGTETDSQKWRQVLADKVYEWFPNPFVEEAIKELPNATETSLLTILSICTEGRHLKPVPKDLDDAKPPTKWLDFIEALVAANNRLLGSKAYPLKRSDFFITQILSVAGRLDIPSDRLDDKLRFESKQAWDALVNGKPEPSLQNTRPAGVPWLPYWLSLSQHENRKPIVVRTLLQHNAYAPGASQLIFSHFGKFTPEEQHEICMLLVRQYQVSFPAITLTPFFDFDWIAAIDSLKRCSSIEESKLEEASQIVKSRIGTAGTMTTPANSPHHFADLLGVPLPESDKSIQTPQLSAPPKGSKSAGQVPTNGANGLGAEVKDTDQEINELILASSSNQPLYRGHSFDEWAAAMQSERSLEMQLLAVDAIVALAESPEQKSRCMRLILEKSRVLGNDVTTSKWIESVVEKMHMFLPDPFLEEALRELPQANTNSISAILRIYRRWGYDGLFGQKPSNTDASPPSPKMLEAIAAISNADSRLSATDPKYQSKETINALLTLAAAWNIPYSSVDKKLQAASKQAWEEIKQTRPPVIQYWLPWLVYWKSLPQSESEKPFVVEMLLSRGGSDFWVRPKIYEHFGKFTPQEQSEICNLFAKQYYSDYSNNYFFSWELPLDCLRRCSTLDPSNLDKAADIVEKRYPREGLPFSSNYANGKTEETDPRIFAELLGATLPPELKSNSTPSAPTKSASKRGEQSTNGTDEIGAWVKASESSGKPMFRGFAFDTWMKTLENERDAKAQLVAGEAVLTLAELPEEKLAAVKGVLQASRELGGIHVEGNPDDYSAKWMAMLHAKLTRFFPDPFLEAALKEVPQANKQSVYAILTVCRRMEKERFLEAGFNSNGPITSPAPGWKELVKELSSFEERVGPNSTNEVKQYLLSEICAMADHVDMPFSELDPKLQNESKRLWEASVNGTVFETASRAEFGTPWIPYWLTLPQAANHKPFIIRAVFANLDRVQSDSQKVFRHFEKFTAEEQAIICELVWERYTHAYQSSWINIEMWQHFFDCLRRCSTLDKSNIDEAAQIIANVRAAFESSIRNRTAFAAPTSADSNKFRQLLGLPPEPEKAAVYDASKSGPQGTAGAQPASSDAELKALMSSKQSGKPLYRGYSFDQWTASLQSERSSEMLKSIVEAMIALAETPEQKSQVVRLMLQKSRELGGMDAGSDNDSQRWMDILLSNINRYLPTPFVDEAIAELSQTNSNSVVAILQCCRHASLDDLLANQSNDTTEKNQLAAKWTELVKAIAGTYDRLRTTGKFRARDSDFITEGTLTLAARLGIPYSELDTRLQNQSKISWMFIKDAQLLQLGHWLTPGMNPGLAWFAYWTTLPQSEQRKAHLLRAILTKRIGNPEAPQLVFAHLDKFTPQEQTDICTIMAQQYRAEHANNRLLAPWKEMFELLRRCSTLDAAKIDKAAAIVKSINDATDLNGIASSAKTAENSPVRFAELLGVTLPLENVSQADATANKQPVEGGNKIRAVVSSSGSSDQQRYREHSFEEWCSVLQNESSIEQQILARDAMIALAETHPQRSQAMRLILQKCRVLGGGELRPDNPSGKWMYSLANQLGVSSLVPHPFLEEAILELPSTNEKSLSAILHICQYSSSERLSSLTYQNGGQKRTFSPQWKELINTLCSARSRLASSNVYVGKRESYATRNILTLAARVGAPLSQLDTSLQAASKEAWETFAKTEPSPVLTNLTYVDSCPWLSYWSTLSQQDKRKTLVVQWLVTHGVFPPDVARVLLQQFEKFTPEEQTAICTLLAQKYQSPYAKFNYLDFDWDSAIDCVRLCSNLSGENIDALQMIIKARRDGEAKASASSGIDVRPERFAELLGVTLPPLAASLQQSVASVKVSNANEGEGPKLDADLNSQIVASQQSDQPLVNGFSRDAWLKVLQNERSGDLMCRAGEALITLATSDEEKLQTCELLLQKSRQLGGSAALPNGSDSENWMAMLADNIYQLFPNPFLRAAENELQKDNKNSALAIAFICFHATPDQLFPDEENKDLNQWKLVLNKLSAIEKYYGMKNTDDNGLSDRERFQLSLSMLAARLDVPYADLPPAVAAKMKALWERELKRPVGDGLGISWEGGLPLWLPYWKTLSQADNRKARIIETLFAASMEESRARPREILDRLDKFTPKEQVEICKVLVTLYSRCEFVPTDYQSLWNDVFECLRRCSTLAPNDIDHAEEMLESARYEYMNQEKDRNQTGFPAELKPKHFHALLGSPFGQNATEGSASAPRPYGAPSSPGPAILTLPPEKWIKPTFGGMM